LRVKARDVGGRHSRVRSVMQQHRFIEKLEMRGLVHDVAGKDIFRQIGRSQRRNVIMVAGESKLQPANRIRPEGERRIESFAVIVVSNVLNRVADGCARAPAVPDLGNVVHTQAVGDYSGGADANTVNGKDATVILKLKQEGTAHGGLHQGAV